MIIEDDDALRALLVAAFKRAGFQCQQAQDGVWALCWVMASRFDLIVSDVLMPRLDGLSAIQRMRERNVLGDAGLIVLSAEDYEERALSLGADQFFRKPVDLKSLIVAARRLCRRAPPAKPAKPASAPKPRQPLRRPPGAAPRPGGSTPAPSGAKGGGPPADRAPTGPALRPGQRRQPPPPRPPGRRDRTVGTTSIFKGEIGEAGLVDVCQMLHTARRTGHLDLDRGRGRGTGELTFSQGELLDACLRDGAKVVERGERALRVFQTWAHGTFKFQARLRGQLVRTIRRPTPRVLADLRGKPTRQRPRLGPFEIMGTLSEGLAGIVHRAQRPGPRGPQAVRVTVLSHSPPESFALHQPLEIPGLGRYYQTGVTSDGKTWVAGQFPRGPSLEHVVQERDSLEQEAALDVFAKVLEGLSALHALGLTHGGLDARRVIMAPGDRPILVDHGLTAATLSARDLITLRASAPEAIFGSGEAKPPADVYAVGVLLFFALTGNYPFPHEDAAALSRAHSIEDPPNVLRGRPDLDPRLGALIADMLKKEADARPISARAYALLKEIRADPRTGEGQATIVELTPLPPMPKTRAFSSDDFADARKAPKGEEPAHQPPRKRRGGDTTSRFEFPLPEGYRFVQRLGAGAAGLVVMAEHETLGRRVAVKMIHPHLAKEATHRKRFLREARISASLDHKGIVRVMDAGESKGTLYLIMELLEGESLQARIEREGAATEREGLQVARQVLSALDFAHRKDVLHRDLKPDNLMIVADGTVKITDFGLAREVQSVELTEQGVILGTPYYMAPEQCLGKPLDARTDLYALGGTLFTLMAGVPPFSGSSIMILIDQHLNADPPPLQDVAPNPISRATAEIVAKLMQKDPELRFQSAAEVLAALPEESR